MIDPRTGERLYPGAVPTVWDPERGEYVTPGGTYRDDREAWERWDRRNMWHGNVKADPSPYDAHPGQYEAPEWASPREAYQWSSSPMHIASQQCPDVACRVAQPRFHGWFWMGHAAELLDITEVHCRACGTVYPLEWDGLPAIVRQELERATDPPRERVRRERRVMRTTSRRRVNRWDDDADDE